MSIKKNLLEIESSRLELIEKSINSSSNFLRLSLYHNYFEKVLSLNDTNIQEAFLAEFIEDYINCICKFEVWGVEPDSTKIIIEVLKRISQLKIVNNYSDEIKYEITRIEEQKEKLKLILDGNEFQSEKSAKAFFPLIDNEAPYEFYGIVDSITVKISKASDGDKFIIVPSETEIEKRIAEQCTQSWLLALTLLKRYVKAPYKFHEVIICFDRKMGFYEGNSLGIALTLSFLQSLLNFYNPSYLINIKSQSAFTGGVLKSGEVLCTSEEIIKRKVAAVFFSEINTFVFPKCEETYAYFSLTQLKQKYPKRKLKLIPVEDINDVLNRRDVVDIKKQKFVVRSGKFIKKNWISAVATVLLAILFAYLFVMDFDDNPAILKAEGGVLYVKNKNGKVLWTKKVDIGQKDILNQKSLDLLFRLIDIDDDGNNEVLITNEIASDISINKSRWELNCYNKNNQKVWSFYFADSVSSEREILEPYYSISLIDTLNFSNQKSLFLISTNSASFSSAIYRIDLKTGQRLPGTLWCSGHTYEALIKDLNYDGKKDILAIGVDNGFEQQVVFAYTIDTLTKVRPSIDEYLINNFPIADFISYIRLTKTDYSKYINLRIPGIKIGSLTDDTSEKVYRFIIQTDFDTNKYFIWIKLNYNLKDIDFIVDNQFRILRDSLVAKGKLNSPYTDTKEYKEILKNNILYWKDGKWVKASDI
ncbi:hypothetical protein [Ignavibacterium album]|uniref:hypothetical protein n=1 Tax=Ignavibacterium album TaxID=591197 RepID=UPI0035B7511C